MSGAKSQELIYEWCQITKVDAPETNQRDRPFRGPARGPACGSAALQAVH